MKEYKRYGDAWEAEVMKNPKRVIVEMLRVVANERDTARSEMEQVKGERDEMREAMKAAQIELRSTAANWSEQCLFDCDAIMTAALDAK